MEDLKKELQDVIDSVKRYVELEQAAGCREFLYFKPETTQSPKDKLKSLKEEVLCCKECELAKTRTHVVFGEGSCEAKLMFVGEAPGFEEDRQARPFVGAAGKLLTKIIEAMGLRRQDVFIANVLKCRPPDNRSPQPDEIIACRTYLFRQIEVISPKVICCLGKFAAQLLLNKEEPIGELRGKFYDFDGRKLIATFHPAYLLRNPADKRLVWNDMKKIMAEL